MEDRISRQAAISIINARLIAAENVTDSFVVDGYRLALRNIKTAIDSIPSTQPETCEGCKHVDKVEYKYISPCSCCKRMLPDYYTQ